MALDFPSNPTVGQTYEGYRYDGSAWRHISSYADTLPAGSVIPWAGSVAPANWLLCNGAAVSRTTYAALFAVIGTTYGVGNGSTTFNVPNLTGRVPVGLDSSQDEFNQLGEIGGAKTHTLTTSEMPSHNHGDYGHSHSQNVTANSGGPAVRRDYQSDGSSWNYWQGANTETAYANISYTGGGAAHNNLQPYTVLNYIIKTTYGTTPEMSQAAQDAASALATASTYSTRVTALESANQTTNKSGLVPVTPTSVSMVGGGSASVSSTGRVTVSGGTGFFLNGIFTSAYRNYKIIIDTKTMGGAYQYMRFTYGDNNHTSAAAYYGGGFYRQASGTGIWSATNGGGYMDIGYTAHSGHTIIEVKAPQVGGTRPSILCHNSYAVSNHTQVWTDWMWDYADQFPGCYIYNSGAGYDAIVEVYGYNH